MGSDDCSMTDNRGRRRGERNGEKNREIKVATNIRGKFWSIWKGSDLGKLEGW